MRDAAIAACTAAKRAQPVSVRAEPAGNCALRVCTRGGDLAHATCMTENNKGMLLDMPLDTTIKVERILRERLRSAAKDRNMTINQFMDALLQEYESDQWAAKAVAQMNAASDEVWAEYMAESAVWDITSSDGLEDEEW